LTTLLPGVNTAAGLLLQYSNKTRDAPKQQSFTLTKMSKFFEEETTTPAPFWQRANWL